MMLNKVKMINCILSSALVMGLLAGCGAQAEQPVQPAQDDIVLEEPVGITANYDVAILRDMYDYKIYSSAVAPYVKEYSFETDQRFKKYGAIPGQMVAKGDTLAYTATKELDRQIEDLNEAIADLEADHASEVEALQKDLADAIKNQYEVGEGFTEVAEFEPDEADEKAHAGWEAIAMGPEGALRRAKQARERVEQSIKESNELYELDHQYKLDSLARLQSKITDSSIIADVDGVVVNYSNEIWGGSYVVKDKPVIAIGDLSVKLLRTEYLSKATVTRAEDVYAIIDGERYEVVHEPMEQEEYNQRKQDGETVYSTFYLQDPDDKLKMGQFAVLVLMKESRSNVLCIPQDAVKVEKNESYCYVYDGENSTYTQIETGMKDGVYVEVLSGLKEGDKVLSAKGVTMGKNKNVLERGLCTTEYSSKCYLTYPYTELLMNPVEQGKTYVKEKFVADFQMVSEGDVLMTLEVVSDNIEIARCNRKLERLAERLAKLQKKKAENDGRKIIDRGVERAITANMKETERVKRTLAKLTKYSGIVEVKAPTNGLIMETDRVKEGDLIDENTVLLRFADTSQLSIYIDDEKGVLSFGNEAQVEYIDENNQWQILDTRVVTVGNTSSSKEFLKNWSIIEVPEEVRDLFNGSRQNDMGAWMRNSFKVTIQTRSMDHVILIPKSAVYMEGGSTYVNVVTEDGTVTRKTFVAGGSNNNYYWAVSGLSEGMNICWE